MCDVWAGTKTINSSFYKFLAQYLIYHGRWRKICIVWAGAVAVAQLLERLLPTPEAWASNAVIAKIYMEFLGTVNWVEKTK